MTKRPLRPMRVGGSAVLAAALLWLVWLWSPADSTQSIPPTADRSPRSSAPAPSAPAPPPSNNSAPAHPAGRPEAPTIQDISVDKSVVCRGEENFVSIRAVGPDGTDTHLRIALIGADEVGPRMPFRLQEPPDEMPKVLVEGRGGAEVVASLPRVEVRDCDAGPIARIDFHSVGASTNEWTFAGSVASGEFTAATYEWDFGDGTRATTHTREVTHSYRFRRQDKRYSSFLISLTMRAANGAVVRASRALGLPNPAFGRLVRHGEVTIFAHRPEQTRETHIQLYHAYDEPVNLERVEVLVRDDVSGRDTAAETHTARDLLGFDRLAPGQAVDVELAVARLQQAKRPLTLVFQVYGTSVDGLPANGVFSTLLQ